MSSAALFNENFLRRLEGLSLLYRRAARSPIQGERRSALVGQSVEFSDFRPYAPGDDFRRIDWNAYARLDRLFLKLFVEEVDVHVHLLIDLSRSMEWGEPQTKLDSAVHLAAALGYIALSGLDRVSAVGLGAKNGRGLSYRLRSIRGKRSALSLFRFLQNLVDPSIRDGSSPVESPAASLANYAAGAAQIGPLILFSDLMDDGWQPALGRLSGRGYEVTVVHVLAPEELDPTFDGDFKLVDAESAAEVEISADYETLRRYRDFVLSWKDGWRKFCSARGIHYIPISSTESLEDLLFASLPRSGVLR